MFMNMGVAMDFGVAKKIAKLIVSHTKWATRKTEKSFGSWQEACEAAGSYSDATVNSFRVQRNAKREADGTVLRESTLSLVARLIEGSGEFSITDFGGATGDLGAELLKEYPKATYTVVENETMVSLMTGKSQVIFSTAIPASCDIFYTGGTLQYIGNPMEALATGLDSAKQFAVLTRNSFCDTEIFRVQMSPLFDNGKGPIPAGFSNQKITYPHRTIRESDVMALANSKGFKCISRLEESSGASAESYGKQLVFQRLS